jgi:hypothetical protein
VGKSRQREGLRGLFFSHGNKLKEHLGQMQFWVLVAISFFLICSASPVWYYTPDSGVFIGTAESMVTTGEYRFNGYPNINYYPGFPALLGVPVFLLGVNFLVLNLLSSAIVVAGLWLGWTYFQHKEYGLAGTMTPILMACTWIVQDQAFRILSDGPFLTVTLGALVLWRIYERTSGRWALAGCFVLVAYASLIRFQGLFLCFAFGLSVLLKAVMDKRRSLIGIAAAAGFGVATLFPFAAWTYRNYLQYTPDTANLANAFFFGRMGLQFYPPEFGKVAWIDSGWKYGIYNLAYQVRELGVVIFNRDVVNLAPTEIVAMLIGTLVLAGSLRWFRNASRFEQIYVIASAAFFFKEALFAGRIFVVQRYWLPLLPFILVSGGFGVSMLNNKLKGRRFRWVLCTLVCLMVLLIVRQGVKSYLYLRSAESYYRTGNEVMAKVKLFMDNDTDPRASVATTDWGVMPFVLKRTCYPVLGIKSHVLTLERMDKYKTQYLVILDGLGDWAEPGRRMVQDLPHLFNLIFEVNRGSNLPGAGVYKVDLKGVAVLLKSSNGGN